jgi:hypothetical protein
VKGGANHFAGPATIAFISIHFDGFNYFLFLLTHDVATSSR